MSEIARLHARIATVAGQMARCEDRILRHRERGEYDFAAGEASHLAVLAAEMSDETARLAYFTAKVA